MDSIADTAVAPNYSINPGSSRHADVYKSRQTTIGCQKRQQLAVIRRSNSMMRPPAVPSLIITDENNIILLDTQIPTNSVSNSALYGGEAEHIHAKYSNQYERRTKSLPTIPILKKL